MKIMTTMYNMHLFTQRSKQNKKKNTHSIIQGKTKRHPPPNHNKAPPPPKKNTASPFQEKKIKNKNKAKTRENTRSPLKKTLKHTQK